MMMMVAVMAGDDGGCHGDDGGGSSVLSQSAWHQEGVPILKNRVFKKKL